MHRRTFLGTTGAAITGVSGCVDVSESLQSNGPSPTASPTESYPAVSVAEVAVTPEYVALDTPDSIDTYGGRGEQFLFARVTTGVEPAPRRGEFRLEAAGESHTPESELKAYGTLPNYRPEYDPGEGGWLPFSVPKPLDAEGATVTWPGNQYALNEEAVDRLSRRPATFAVREFTAPSSVEAGRAATVSLAVENTGETNGTFVGALNRVGPWVAHAPVEAIDLEVDAGATQTWEHTQQTNEPTETDRETVDMTFHLHWRDGDRSATTAVRMAE